jgi:hypothetical protein
MDGMVRPSSALAHLRWDGVSRQKFAMIRYALAGALMTAFLAGPAASGGSNAPKMTKDSEDARSSQAKTS